MRHKLIDMNTPRVLVLLSAILISVPCSAQMPSSWQVVEKTEVKGPIPKKDQLGVVVEVKDAEIQEKLQEECVKYLTLLGFPADAIVATGDTSKVSHVVVVAQSRHSALANRLESAGESVDWDALGEEGVLIRHVPLDAKHYLLIAGNTKRAVQYALYYYLERVCHVGFFEDGEQVPRVDVLPFEGLNLRSRPYFSMRRGWQFGSGSGSWHHGSYYWGAKRNRAMVDCLVKKRLNWSMIDISPRGTNSWAVMDDTFPEIPPLEDGALYGEGQYQITWDWPPQYRKELVQDMLGYGRTRGLRFQYALDARILPERLARAYPDFPYMPVEKVGYGISTLLDPRDDRSIPLMQKIIKATLDAFGTDHVYHAGTFGESDFGAGKEDETLRLATALKQYDIFNPIDPETVWMTDSWGFHTRVFKQGDFLRRYINALKGDRFYLYDTGAELFATPVYKKSEGFYGQKYSLGILHSYGGSDHLHGNLQHLIDLVRHVRDSPAGKSCDGITYCPEIHYYNLMYWDLVSQLAWDPRGLTLEKYLADYTRRRYGPASYDTMRPAIDLLVQAVYNKPFGSGVIPGQWHTPDDPYYSFAYLGFGNPGGWPCHVDHPGPNVLPLRRLRSETTIPVLRAAIEQALKAEPQLRESQLWKNDLIDMTRTYLGIVSDLHVLKMYDAFKAQDEATFEREAEASLAPVEMLVKVLATHDDYSLTEQIKQVMQVPGTNSGTPEMIRQCCIVFGFYNSRDVTEQIRDANLPMMRHAIEAHRQSMKEGKREIRFHEIQDLIWHGDGAKAILKKWMDGPMAPDVEGPREDTVKVVRAALKFH